MKKILGAAFGVVAIILLAGNFIINADTTNIEKIEKNKIESEQPIVKFKEKTELKYNYPKFYKGIYLNVYSSRNMKKLKKFVKMAKESHINAIVMDVQSSKLKKSIIPKENVKFCIDNNIHPIARVVMFPKGLNKYPVSDKYIEDKITIAESACLNGFKEIQFDYIRFNDSSKLRKVSLKKKYAFIKNIMKKVRKRLKKYDVKIAVDVFGRIPLNRNDIIGQKMEVFDEVVDLICPMAYPSHYWTKKLQHDPYYTVKWTSENARKRTKKAEIVTYIQAFKLKMPKKMSYAKYIEEQIKGIHDANIRGYFFWNASQKYKIPLQVTKKYYDTKI